MKACPHCGLPLESTAPPIPKHRFVSHYWRETREWGQIKHIEIAPFTEFHASEARTVLHELGLTIERATYLIDRWNRAGTFPNVTYRYDLGSPG